MILFGIGHQMGAGKDALADALFDLIIDNADDNDIQLSADGIWGLLREQEARGEEL